MKQIIKTIYIKSLIKLNEFAKYLIGKVYKNKILKKKNKTVLFTPHKTAVKNQKTLIINSINKIFKGIIKDKIKNEQYVIVD